MVTYLYWSRYSFSALFFHASERFPRPYDDAAVCVCVCAREDIKTRNVEFSSPDNTSCHAFTLDLFPQQQSARQTHAVLLIELYSCSSWIHFPRFIFS